MTSRLDFDGRWAGPRNLGTATLGLSAAGTTWTDIGSAVSVGGAAVARAFLSVHINNGTNARFRLAGLYTATSSAFGIAAQNSGGTGVIPINDQIFELEQDADQDISFAYKLDGAVPFVKLQGLTAGGTATYVSNARLVTSL